MSVATANSSNENGSVRLSLDVSPKMNEALEAIANDLGTSKSDVLRRAVVLLEAAHEAKNDGYHFGITDDRNKLDREIIGVFR